MKLIGWAIALAAVGLTPAAAAAPQVAAQQELVPQPGAGAQPEAPGQRSALVPGVDPAANTAAEPAAPAAAPEDVPADREYGVPVAGGKGIQHQVTEVGEEAADFHNGPLLFLCAAISLFVLGLLIWTMVRYRRGVNPTPSRTSHNTLIEVIWTVVPVLILVAIAIPSMRLLRHQYDAPKADVTVKVIGNQWYWTYQYPDHGDFEVVSNMLKEQADVKPGERYRTDADGPPLLAVDERIVIPQGKVVKFLVTSNDVIHAFAIPAFWTKIDANPGMINETWVKVDRPGVYFGQCSELCGARHAYMPIAVEVVPEAKFAAWVAEKGGTMPGATPAAAPAPTPAAGTPTEAEPTVQPPVTNQAATAQN